MALGLVGIGKLRLSLAGVIRSSGTRRSELKPCGIRSRGNMSAEIKPCGVIRSSRTRRSED